MIITFLISRLHLFLFNICIPFSQYAVDPSNSMEDDEVDVADAVLHDGAPKAASFGIEDEEPSDGDENKKKCWMYLNSMRDVLSDAAAVDAAAAVDEVAARSVSRIRISYVRASFFDNFYSQDIWACDKCTFENTDMTSDRCEMCNEVRSK